MTRQRIAIDMDEVLADTLGAVVKAVNERADLNIKMESLNGKKLKHMIPEHEGLVMDILKEPGFFRNLDVMPHAQEVVKQLNEHYDIYIATAAMDVPTSFHDKYEWLLEYFPFLDPQHFVVERILFLQIILLMIIQSNWKFLKGNQLCLLLLIMLMNIDLNA